MNEDPQLMRLEINRQRRIIERWHEMDAESEARITRLETQRDIASAIIAALVAILAMVALRSGVFG